MTILEELRQKEKNRRELLRQQKVGRAILEVAHGNGKMTLEAIAHCAQISRSTARVCIEKHFYLSRVVSDRKRVFTAKCNA